MEASERVALARELNANRRDRNYLILGIIAIIIVGAVILYTVNKNTAARITGHFRPKNEDIYQESDF